MVDNITLFQNLTGFSGFYEVTNYYTQGWLTITLLLIIWYAMFTFMREQQNPTYRSLAVSGILIFIPAVLLRFRVYAGVPMVSDIFLITLTIAIAIFVTLMYVNKPK